MNKKAQMEWGYQRERIVPVWFIVMLVLGLLFIGVVMYLSMVGLPIEDSRGQHTGYVTAVETNGVIFKTHRAYVKSDISSSQEDSYCVIDNAVKQQLEQVSINKEKVTVYFYDWMFRGWNNCKMEETAIIYRVEVIR